MKRLLLALMARAAKSGLELVNVGVEQTDAFTREQVKVCDEVGMQMGLGNR